MVAAFELYRDRSGAYRWRLKGADGAILAAGESYESHAAAERAVEAVRAAAPAAEIRVPQAS